jgi:tetratricopeptide (TPR) repeat protein
LLTPEKSKRELEQAIKAHQSKHLELAQQLYAIFLEKNPSHSQGHYLLGCVYAELNLLVEAAVCLEKSIELVPSSAVFHYNLGVVRQSQKQNKAAYNHFLKAVDLKRDYIVAWNALGGCRLRDRDYLGAQRCFTQATDFNSQFADAWLNSARASLGLGQLDEVRKKLDKVLELDPSKLGLYLCFGDLYRRLQAMSSALQAYKCETQKHPQSADAWNSRGNCHLDIDQLEEACQCYLKAIKIESFAEAHNNLALCYQRLGDLDKAQCHYLKALKLQPDYAEAHNNLGSLYLHQEDLEAAKSQISEALRLDSRFAAAVINLGNCFKEELDFDEALVWYQKALEIDPNNVGAIWNRSLVYLLTGRLCDGFKTWDIREHCKELKLIKRDFDAPLWDGSLEPKGCLLLHAEQGFGDSIQFARYISQAKRRVQNIILESHPALHRLFYCLLGEARIFSPQDQLPPFDFHSPLPNLPHIFEASLENLPGDYPYLQSTPSSTSEKLLQVFSASSGFRVGVVWSGNPNHGNNHRRSCPLTIFDPLGEVQGVNWFSLQVDPPLDQVFSSSTLDLTDLSPYLKDFNDTAEALEYLDLLISVDTSIIHLAGAMGKTGWLLVPYNPDWRWLMNREDSPWYPSLRLFRQKIAGDWDDVLQRIRHQLDSLIHGNFTHK